MGKKNEHSRDVCVIFKTDSREQIYRPLVFPRTTATVERDRLSESPRTTEGFDVTVSKALKARGAASINSDYKPVGRS